MAGVDPGTQRGLASPAGRPADDRPTGISRGQTYFGPIAQTFALEAMRSGQVVFSDLHRSRFAGYIHLDIVIPIVSGPATPCRRAAGQPWGETGQAPFAGTARRVPRTNGACPLFPPGAPPADLADARLVGVIDIEVTPDKFLYPHPELAHAQPHGRDLAGPAEGDEVVFLNELRRRKGAPLSLRLPVGKKRGWLPRKRCSGRKGLPKPPTTAAYTCWRPRAAYGHPLVPGGQSGPRGSLRPAAQARGDRGHIGSSLYHRRRLRCGPRGRAPKTAGC